MQQNGVAIPASQQLRFAKAKSTNASVMPKKKVEGALKDHNLRLAKPLWTPSFSVAFRLIIILRFFAAMYSSISDCDEVFNYWEPLHYLVKGTGFQTWEYSPDYAIRSYFYLLVNAFPTFLTRKFTDKRATFFAVRLFFATISSLVEAAFYRSAVTFISPHVGRYLLITLLFSAGFFSAASAFLPSTFAMWGVMLGTAASLSPVDGDWARITVGTVCYAIAAIVGWPFSVLLGVPMVLEQLFIRGTERVPAGKSAAWAARRAQNMFIAVVAGATILIPVIYIDSVAYQKFVIVPLNIINYNLFSTSGGPNLYGTEAPSFYILNGLLAFNILLPLALLSIPLLFISSIFDPKRTGDLRDRIIGQTSPYLSLAIRLSPLYLWMGVLTLQAHKEERFLFPAYGLILLNGCTSLYLIRGMLEQAFLKITKSPWKTTQTSLFSNFTRGVLLLTTLFSVFRIFALHTYYHAPLNIYHHFQTYELPRLALTLFPSNYPPIDPYVPFQNFSTALSKAEFTIDLEPLAAINLRLCLGKEWHRYTSSFLVPNEAEVGFIQSEFKGILPKVWEVPGEGKGLFNRATGTIPSGMNDLNKEEVDRYVDISTCHYLIDLDFPLRSNQPGENSLEPRYAIQEENWDRVHCKPFLDNENSARWSRTLLVPVPRWQNGNQFGDYCLLRNKKMESLKGVKVEEK